MELQKISSLLLASIIKSNIYRYDEGKSIPFNIRLKSIVFSIRQNFHPLNNISQRIIDTKEEYIDHDKKIIIGEVRVDEGI
ncbi:hypothetical protein J2S21_004000 [Peribacillus cavernae]|nr:hypothetical protein [Peribacillus cavernae]